MNSVAARRLTIAKNGALTNCIFGRLSISPEDLSQKIKAMVPPLAKRLDPKENNTAYTTAVKETLDSIAAEVKKTLDSSASEYLCESLRTREKTETEPKCAEFMLDLVWWEKTASGERAVLGVESEWGNPWHLRAGNIQGMVDAVDGEFWKLLSFKAPLKLLVYTANGSAMRLAMHRRLRADLSKFKQHVKGECYLLVEFSQTGHCFRYMFLVGSDGAVQNPEFTPMDDESRRALAA